MHGDVLVRARRRLAKVIIWTPGSDSNLRVLSDGFSPWDGGDADRLRFFGAVVRKVGAKQWLQIRRVGFGPILASVIRRCQSGGSFNAFRRGELPVRRRTESDLTSPGTFGQSERRE